MGVRVLPAPVTCWVIKNVVYVCFCLAAESGDRYVARFPTREKWSTVRLPFALFRPENEGQAPLLPDNIKHIAIR